ncbi:MAG TPA: hypothetical protein VHB25_01175 [Gemmatimonadaceae bacterium]|nr:hypothetical protein [Gemmatimonadaceae bacterium]
MPRCTVLIPSADRSCLLVVRDGERLALPTVTIESDWIAAEVGAIQAAVRDGLGVDAVVLREIAGDVDDRAVELERISDAPMQSGAALVDVSALDELLLDADARAIVQRWKAALPDAGAAPWMQRGWFAAARAWIDARLAERGAARVGPLRQIKGGWDESAVFAAATSAGDVYFKAASGPSIEPAVLAGLSGRRRGAPGILAIEHANTWMLMAAAGGQADAARFPDALRQFAELQRAEAPHAAEWLATGAPDRRGAMMRARLPRLLVDVPEQLHRGGLLSAAEATALRGALPHVDALCEQLGACGIPDTLVHDDFQPGNVLGAGGELVFVDWSDVAVAHPFFSAHHFIATAAGSSPEALREAYLEPWTGVVDAAAARAAFDMSAALAPVYRALFNDRMADYEAWLATSPPPAQRAFARGVFTTILDALSVDR